MLRSILVVFPSVRWGDGQGIKDSATVGAAFIVPQTGEMGSNDCLGVRAPFPHVILVTAGFLP